MVVETVGINSQKRGTDALGTELITKTPISLINKKDYLVWQHRKDGQYIVRTGYHVIRRKREESARLRLIRIEGRFGKLFGDYRGGVRKRITWRTPPKNRLKVNTDTTFHRDTGTAALAAVVRDWQGKVITGTTATFKTISPLTSEAQAYREALILIKNLQIPNCIIETDSLPLVQAIKARTPIAEAYAIIRDILQLLEEAPDVGARDGNKLAHQLAAIAAENNLGRQWTVNPPTQLRNTIRLEASLATIQHIQDIQNQVIQNPANNNSDSTTHQELHQELQIEETLLGGVEKETRDKPSAKIKEHHRPKAMHLPTNDSHKKVSDRADKDRGGGAVDRAEIQNAVCRRGEVARQIRLKAMERGAARETGFGGRQWDADQGGTPVVRRSNGLLQHENLRIRDDIGNGRGGARNHEHAQLLEEENTPLDSSL
ncbi:hypothetical protein Ahy_B05g075111 [Arachis hypogaea]|uniref:RNase H type-1 domain-containing protein n=1 Tax=Arachis hypogaea TaxID=3818 RepID=A0A444Z0K5_ARAHY|nr:hypothetical protein Ahy_B05g075111 [Arachis hypogaea]